jgi:hypothetical protein
MASTFTQSVLATTYKDDYRDSDHYHRILFNSGRALQARELTQLQTIIQSEMARFGRNIFKEGASVNPGGGTLDNNYTFVKLNTAVNTLPTTNIVGNIFTGQTSGLRAKILEVVPAEGSDPATIYIEYIGGVSGGVTTALRFTPGENITDGTNTLTVQTTDTDQNPASGAGVRFSIATGEFFTKGHFVFVEQQSIILSKYYANYTGVVGFRVVEDIVTVADNVALYDNQGATPNTTAPGADRYRIRLILTDITDVDSDGAFVYYAEIVDSVIVSNVTGTDEYNKINELLAKRTKEESGDYIVKPFTLKFDLDSDNNYLLADVSPGVAYINGYRVEIPAPRQIRFSKPRTVSFFNNQAIAANYGNYVVCSTIKGTPLINTIEKWNLRSATGYGGSTIGTARVRAVEEDGSVYKYYLTDVVMTGFNNFRDVRSIGVSVTTYADLVLENSIAVIKDASNNDLLFPLPYERPANLTDISLQVQKRFTTTNASGTATLGPGNLGTGETWAEVNSWIITVDSSGNNISSTVSVSGAGTTTATISGIPVGNGATIEVLAYIDKSAGVVATKTMTETTRTATIESDGSGNKYFDLRKADVYDVLRVRDSDSNGADLSNYFRFDNGGRDNFYDTGKLRLKSTFSAPTGNIFARFKYFAHGAGDFFAAPSYDSATTGLTYGEIPNHTLADGTTINLRNYIDFRSRIGDRGTTFDSATASVRLLPKNTDLIRADASYYMPRYDKLSLGETGKWSYIEGVSSFQPAYPSNRENSLELYKIRLNANTFNDSDLSITAIDHKRYTMADIGALEKRIDRLEEYTTLSLLELETSTWSVVDSTGIPRTKAGFLSDGFADHFFSDTTSTEYRASIDPRAKVVRPPVISHNVRLKYDSDLSQNVVLRGDNLYLRYNDVEFITQTFASEAININPFHVVNTVGIIELSPASDEWKETSYVGARVIDGGTRIDKDPTHQFNEWQWQWQGSTSGTSVGSEVGRSTSSTSSTSTTPITGGGSVTTTTATTTTVVDRIVSDETIRQVTGDRVVDIAVIPFMRSRKVHFKAFGLKPFQQYFPFFNNVNVSSWVREEPFVRFATTSTDYGNVHNNATQHPEGSSVLETDASGIIEGSFFIPNTNSIRFRSGTREFKLLNVNSSNEADATSIGTTLYTANGVLETRQQDILSTRALAVRSFVSTSIKTSTTVQPPPPPPPEPPLPPPEPRPTVVPIDAGWTIPPVPPPVSPPPVTPPVANPPIIVDPPLPPVPPPVLPPPMRWDDDDDQRGRWVPVTPPVRRTNDDQRSCFVAGTLVTMADGTKKAIEDVQIGEMLLGQDGYTNRVIAFDHPPLAGRDLIGINGNGKFMTPEHPLFTKNGWRSFSAATFERQFPDMLNLNVKDLQIGDEIQKEDGSWLTVNSLEVFENEPEQTVYNFILDGNNTYFADGLLAHNRGADPLAQTFFVGPSEGIFVTNIAIFFKTKPTNPENPATVTLEIRPVVNGYPDSLNVVPGSSVTKAPSEINLPAAQTQEAVVAAPTFFTFPEPIFLNGNTEYAVVLLTGTTDYNVYVAQADAFVLGSTQKRITQQPTLGSLFKSQNARTWEADQTRDLSFVLYRADFIDNAGYAVLENVNIPQMLLDQNPFQVDSGSRWVTVYQPYHGFDSGDYVNIQGLDSSTRYGGILGRSIQGLNQVSFPDVSGYQIYVDSAATASQFVGGSTVLANRNIMYDIINPHVDTLIPPTTNIATSAKLTTGRSLAGTESRFYKDAAFNTIILKEDNYAAAPLVVADRSYEVLAPMNGERSITLKIDMRTGSSAVSPVIDMQRASTILVNNIIDKQDSDRSLSGFNTPIIFVNETDPTDGTHVAKHVTVPVTLAENASGLQVVVSANRPSDADFLVYYRTATTGENIRLKNWVYSPLDVPVPPDNNPNVFREYRYLIGGRNGTLTPFTEYQLKIVFRSTNSSKVPVLTDLRVIALAD